MHNGKILCTTAYIMGIGSFLMCLPHFIAGEYVLGPKPVDFCDLSGEYQHTSLICRFCLGTIYTQTCMKSYGGDTMIEKYSYQVR